MSKTPKGPVLKPGHIILTRWWDGAKVAVPLEPEIVVEKRRRKPRKEKRK